MMIRSVPFLGLLILLGGCGAGAATEAGPPISAGRFAPSAPLIDLKGRNADELLTLFGIPGLDVVDGPSRKLQFANDRCVVDAYLYAPRPGQTPVVSYAEARDRTGEAAEMVGCLALLRRR